MLNRLVKRISFLISLILGSSLILANDSSVSSTATKAPTHFAVISDTPYSDAEYAALEHPDGVIEKAIKALDPPLLIHLGDFKLARAGCTDELFKDRYRQIAQLHPHRTIYTPGDNDWTDCDRLTFNFSTRYDELERLEFLRQIFFNQDELQLSKDIVGLVRQQGFVENARWQLGDILFATLHLPGTNNGRNQIERSNKEDAFHAADLRDQYNEAWLVQLFQTAQSNSSIEAVVIAFHADIYEYENDNKPACSKAIRTNCNGYQKIIERIKNLVTQFEKPVLTMHGDSLPYCFNQPYEDIPNLWRLNAAGDRVYMEVSQVVFDSTDKTKPFTVSGILDQKPAPSSCGLGFLLNDLFSSPSSIPEKP